MECALIRLIIHDEHVNQASAHPFFAPTSVCQCLLGAIPIALLQFIFAVKQNPKQNLMKQILQCNPVMANNTDNEIFCYSWLSFHSGFR